MPEAVSVSVVIPTFRRPESLDRALRSLLAMTHIPDGAEVVVVDNDAGASAARTVALLAKTAPLPIRYVHEPAAGVANARNAGVLAAQGELIAFLDDDETASPEWLAKLLEAQTRFQADVVFGPVVAAIPEGARHRDYLQRFFSRIGPETSQAIDGYYGCGASLVRRGALPDPAQPFSAARNLIGGEDDLLFGEMKRRGARFAWAVEAWVHEHPEPQRLSLGYALKRAFAFGQGPSSDAWAAGPKSWPMAPVWMAWGAVQAVAYGLLAAFRPADGRAEALDRAARGLGKLLWFPPFKIAFYGQV
jgi:glycosyltransferase involved in cell wall biosynthesis